MKKETRRMQVNIDYLHCDAEENKGKYHHVKKRWDKAVREKGRWTLLHMDFSQVNKYILEKQKHYHVYTIISLKDAYRKKMEALHS